MKKKFIYSDFYTSLMKFKSFHYSSISFRHGCEKLGCVVNFKNKKGLHTWGIIMKQEISPVGNSIISIS